MDRQSPALCLSRPCAWHRATARHGTRLWSKVLEQQLRSAACEPVAGQRLAVIDQGNPAGLPRCWGQRESLPLRVRLPIALVELLLQLQHGGLQPTRRAVTGWPLSLAGFRSACPRLTLGSTSSVQMVLPDRDLMSSFIRARDHSTATIVKEQWAGPERRLSGKSPHSDQS